MPSRAQARRWRALKRRKGRAEHGLFLAEGHRLVADLLDSELELRHLLYTAAAEDEPAAAAVLDRARQAEVPDEQVDPGELAEFADTVAPQNLLAVGGIPVRRPADLGEGDLVVLDAVQDPGNAGTILRTAEALGASGAVSLKGTVDLWNPKTVRASAGALFRLPVMDAEWPEAGAWIEASGRSLWAADAGGEELGRGAEVARRLALVLGNEGSGVRTEILEAADRRVAVRLPGGAESLNVAVAAALLMDRIFSARRT